MIGSYEAVEGGAGCAESTITEGECKDAAGSLGFDSSKGYEVLNYNHLPHGCFVGHAHTSWKYTYYNQHVGTTNPHFKSICGKGIFYLREIF